jgi:hypothetical protein
MISKLCFLFFSFQVAVVVVTGYLNRGYPECTSMAFTEGNRLDLQTMLYNCSKNIPGNLAIPSFFPYDNNEYYPLNVSIGIVINNFIAVDDVTTTINMDFWYRNIWTDPRWNLPEEAWQYLNPIALIEGLDITEYFNNQNNPLQIWVPDIVFYEGVALDVLAEMLKLFPNGTLFWSRHFVVTLTEANMDLLQYPLDSQNFSMTFQSYAYATQLMMLEFMPAAISFNYNDQVGVDYVDLNQIWTYQRWTAYILTVDSPVIFNPDRKYSTAYMNIEFSRQSFGIVYRLGLPIAMFLVLVGFSFWANIDKRIDVTLQMLLVVAALYLVIGQIIPFVGYFTRMDMYITTAFLILIFTTGIHFCTLLLERKVNKYPANAFMRDCLVYFFRVIWIPFALLIFVVFFKITEVGVIAGLIIACVVSVSNAWLNRKYLKDSFKIAILNLREKERVIQEANKVFMQKQQELQQQLANDNPQENIQHTAEGYVRRVKQITPFEKYLLDSTRKYFVNQMGKNRSQEAQAKSIQALRDMSFAGYAVELEDDENKMGDVQVNPMSSGDFEMTSFSNTNNNNNNSNNLHNRHSTRFSSSPNVGSFGQSNNNKNHNNDNNHHNDNNFTNNKNNNNHSPRFSLNEYSVDSDDEA